MIEEALAFIFFIIFLATIAVFAMVVVDAPIPV